MVCVCRADLSPEWMLNAPIPALQHQRRSISSISEGLAEKVFMTRDPFKSWIFCSCSMYLYPSLRAASRKNKHIALLYFIYFQSLIIYGIIIPDYFVSALINKRSSKKSDINLFLFPLFNIGLNMHSVRLLLSDSNSGSIHECSFYDLSVRRTRSLMDSTTSNCIGSCDRSYQGIKNSGIRFHLWRFGRLLPDLGCSNHSIAK